MQIRFGNLNNYNSFLSFVLIYTFMDIRNRILIKAEELSRSIGFRALTMDELANQLGISKKTIYQYYTDKDALVNDVMSEVINKSQIMCKYTSESAENAIDELLMTMKQIRQDFQNLNPIFLHDLQKYYPEPFNKFQYHKNNFIFHLIHDNLVKGIAQGYYRPEIDADILAKFRIESILIAFNQHVFPSAHYKLIEVTHAIFEHFLYGISTSKGLQLIQQSKTIQNNDVSAS